MIVKFIAQKNIKKYHPMLLQSGRNIFKHIQSIFITEINVCTQISSNPS